MYYFGRSCISLNLMKTQDFISKKAAQRRTKIIDLFLCVFMLKPVEFNDFFIFSINSHRITFIFAPGYGPGARLERNGRALGARRGRSGRELGARHARQRRCFPFKCNRTNALTSGPFGHLYWLARSKLRPCAGRVPGAHRARAGTALARARA